MVQVAPVGDAVVAHPFTVLRPPLAPGASTASPAVAFRVALLLATETMAYHPGIQFDPEAMNSFAPTSPETKL